MTAFYLRLSNKSDTLKQQLLIVPQKCVIKEMYMSMCDTKLYSCISKIYPNLFPTDYIYILYLISIYIYLYTQDIYNKYTYVYIYLSLLADNFANTLISSQLKSFQ